MPGLRRPLVLLGILMVTAMTESAMSAEPATQVGTFSVRAPLARVFPMFTAVGERAWAQGWDPTMLSGSEERGSAFATRAHDGKGVTWIVTDYRPREGKVSYARLAAESNIGLVDVSCIERAPGRTEVTVRYTLTGLNQTGRAFVVEFLQDAHYSTMMEEWRAAISRALGVPASP